MSLRLTGRREASTVMAQSQDDNFIVVAQASSPEELRQVTPTIRSIEDGTRGRTIITSPIWAPIGPLADLAGAETIFRRVFVAEGIDVIDVHGEGFTTAVIDWRVSPTLQSSQGGAEMNAVITIAVILGLIVIALLATGWVIRTITVLIEALESAFGGSLPLLVGGIIVIVGLGAFSQTKNRGST